MITWGFIPLACACIGLQADPWAQVWTELEALRSGKTSAAEAEVLRGHLGDALHEGSGGPRAELLRAALEATSGTDVTPAAERLAALDPSPFSARELWFLGDLMPKGAARARIVLTALEADAPLADWQVLLAWNVAVDEIRALRIEETALPIQVRLHERYQAAWSAEDLALTYKSLGRWQAADEVLAQAIGKELDQRRQPAALWERRGILALGFGDETAARDYLGLALAQGSDDAGLLLSRLDLIAARGDDARRGYQALILGRPPPDWAWRGWGMALLPPPFAEQATLNRPSPE
jgi:tetratricopeptide (TPR) repeat protein